MTQQEKIQQLEAEVLRLKAERSYERSSRCSKAMNDQLDELLDQICDILPITLDELKSDCRQFEFWVARAIFYVKALDITRDFVAITDKIEKNRLAIYWVQNIMKNKDKMFMNELHKYNTIVHARQEHRS